MPHPHQANSWHRASGGPWLPASPSWLKGRVHKEDRPPERLGSFLFSTIWWNAFFSPWFLDHHWFLFHNLSFFSRLNLVALFCLALEDGVWQESWWIWWRVFRLACIRWQCFGLDHDHFLSSCLSFRFVLQHLRSNHARMLLMFKCCQLKRRLSPLVKPTWTDFKNHRVDFWKGTVSTATGVNPPPFSNPTHSRLLYLLVTATIRMRRSTTTLTGQKALILPEVLQVVDVLQLLWSILKGDFLISYTRCLKYTQMGLALKSKPHWGPQWFNSFFHLPNRGFIGTRYLWARWVRGDLINRWIGSLSPCRAKGADVRLLGTLKLCGSPSPKPVNKQLKPIRKDHSIVV